MPAHVITVSLTMNDGANPFANTKFSTRAKLRAYMKVVKQLTDGMRMKKAVLRYGTAQATGTVTLATSSGTVGATINGVSVTTTFATSDTVTATALAAAINASSNALVQNHVTATSAAGVVTITAVRSGIGGNAITLAASGTGATASGARLTGATDATTVTF